MPRSQATLDGHGGAIGLLAGVPPARRAAQLDPVAALRTQ